MKKLYLIITGALLIMSGCARELGDNGGFPEQENTAVVVNTSGADARRGVLNIKLSEEALKSLSPQAMRSGGIVTGNADLDKALSELGAYRIERVFPHGGAYEVRMRKAGLHRWYTIRFDEEKPVTRAADGFVNIPGVEVIEASYLVYRTDDGGVTPLENISTVLTAADASLTFNDPRLADQWHYDNRGGKPNMTAGADINLSKAWEITTGDPSVIVAVLDGGVDWTHEDLKANMWVNWDEYYGAEGVNDNEWDTGNHYVDDIHGWNFFNDEARLYVTDHATHIAGTIAAVNNNGLGVCGIAGGNGEPGSGVRIMTCQIFSKDSSAPHESVSRAFVYAANNGAVITQNSYGSPFYSQVLAEAISYFAEYAGTDPTGEFQIGPMRGGISISTAGNASLYRPEYPGALDNVFCVAAMRSDFEKAWYSSFGPWVNVTAPGGDKSYLSNEHGIISTVYRGYGSMEGTSMACPHVSGIAALAVSRFGANRVGFTGAQLWKILEESVNDIYEFLPDFEGWLGTGYIDAYKAVTYNIGMEELPAAPGGLKARWMKDFIELSWTIDANGKGEIPTKYQIIHSEGDLSGLNLFNIPAGIPMDEITTAGRKSGDAMDFTISGLKESAAYHVIIRGMDAEGNSSPRIYLVNTTGKDEAHDPPVQYKDLPEMEVVAGRSLVVNFDDYFRDGIDPALTYEVTYDSSQLSAEQINRASYDFTGLKEGLFEVRVTAINNGGKSVSASFRVNVLSDRLVILKDFEEVDFPSVGESASINLSEYFSQGGGKISYAAFADGSIVKADIAGDVLSLSAAGKGLAQVVIEAVGEFGAAAEASFLVRVGNGKPKLYLAPNPVKDLLQARSSVGCENAVLKFYSQGGALVKSFTVDLSPREAATVDVSSLGSGVYKVAVEINNEIAVHQITKL